MNASQYVGNTITFVHSLVDGSRVAKVLTNVVLGLQLKRNQLDVVIHRRGDICSEITTIEEISAAK